MTCSSKELIAKIDGYQLGVQHGKTMAEVDAYYEGLLREIEELKRLFNRNSADSPSASSPSVVSSGSNDCSGPRGSQETIKKGENQ